MYWRFKRRKRQETKILKFCGIMNGKMCTVQKAKLDKWENLG